MSHGPWSSAESDYSNDWSAVMDVPRPWKVHFYQFQLEAGLWSRVWRLEPALIPHFAVSVCQRWEMPGHGGWHDCLHAALLSQWPRVTMPHISLRVNWMNFLKSFRVGGLKYCASFSSLDLAASLKDVLNDFESGQGISILCNPRQSRGGGSIISGLALTMIGCFANTQGHLASASPPV